MAIDCSSWGSQDASLSHTSQSLPQEKEFEKPFERIIRVIRFPPPLLVSIIFSSYPEDGKTVEAKQPRYSEAEDRSE